ncbi:hypothetical protein ACX9NE_00940 [Mycobacterium sp. ML4]
MNAITFSQARCQAEKLIYEMARREHLGEVMIVDSEIVETDSAWYFPYDAVA